MSTTPIAQEVEHEFDRLNAEIASLTAQLAALEWQPIESAPKDGTSIILYVAWRIVGEARWQGDGHDEGWWWAGTDPGDYNADKISSQPTHWMALPEPPMSEDQRQQGKVAWRE